MAVSDQKPGAAPRRSRIVIDVGKDKESSPAMGRARRTGGGGGGGAAKVLLVIALVIVAIFAVVGIGGFLWYRSYKQTPAYSLALLADSVQRNDMQAFDRFVDLDRVTENFLPQVVERTGGDAGSILSTVNNASGGGANAAAQMLPGVREAVRDEFVRQAREASASGANVPVFLIALAVPRVVDSITEEANAARVNLKIQNRPVELTMERAEIEGEPRWRVVSVRDDALATRIAEQLQQGTLPRGLTDQLPEGLPNLDDLPLNRGGRNNNGGSNRSNERSNRNARRPSNSSPSPTPRRPQGRNANDFLRDLPTLPIP